MAQKLKFTPNPTFKIDVQIPVAGVEENPELTMTFKHLTPEAFAAVVARAGESVGAPDATPEHQQQAMVDALKELAEGWAWSEDFNDQNILATIQNYPAFYAAVVQQYGEELWKVRKKN